MDNKKETALPLAEIVKQTLAQYFEHLEGQDPSALYAMVIAEVERPLLQVTLEYSGQNQSKAAKLLGLSRSTLRKKLDYHGLS